MIGRGDSTKNLNDINMKNFIDNFHLFFNINILFTSNFFSAREGSEKYFKKNTQKKKQKLIKIWLDFKNLSVF